MKKIILASASAIALLGLAACSESDNTTTQSTTPEVQQTEPAPMTPPAAEPAPTDDTTTQSTTPDEPAMQDDGAADESNEEIAPIAPAE